MLLVTKLASDCYTVVIVSGVKEKWFVSEAKVVYTAPELIIHGKLVEITQQNTF